MPIWFELIVTGLAAYSFGVALGWLLWSRRIRHRPGIDEPEEEGKDIE